MKRYLLVGIGVIIGLLLTLTAWRLMNQAYKYQGSLIDPPVSAANFELTDQNGSLFRLSDQQGKVVLVFFGFTNCVDICPATLSQYKAIKSALGKQAQDMRFVFITVDPERDSTEKIGAYLASFDPSFVGLTGDRAVLENVWKDYGVYVEKQAADAAGGYEVDHTAIVYAIDARGNWRLTYPFGMETGRMVQDLRHLVEER
jgi:protein SCO1